MAAAVVDQADLAAAEVESPVAADRLAGHGDLGVLELIERRRVGAGGQFAHQPGTVDGQGGGRGVVSEDGHVSERVVAQAVIQVPVGVHCDQRLAGDRCDGGSQLLTLSRGDPGVDDQGRGLPQDEAYVEVPGLEPAVQDAVGQLAPVSHDCAHRPRPRP